eukprot:gene718-8970_t
MPLKKDGEAEEPQSLTEELSRTGRILYSTETRVHLPPVNSTNEDLTSTSGANTPVNESEHDQLINNDGLNRNFVDLEGQQTEEEEQTDLEEQTDVEQPDGSYVLDEDPVETGPKTFGVWFGLIGCCTGTIVLIFGLYTLINYWVGSPK